MRRWTMKKCLSRLIRQGPQLEGDVIDLFRMIREQWADEFTEDNAYTQHAHLMEMFIASREDRRAR